MAKSQRPVVMDKLSSSARWRFYDPFLKRDQKDPPNCCVMSFFVGLLNAHLPSYARALIAQACKCVDY